MMGKINHFFMNNVSYTEQPVNTKPKEDNRILSQRTTRYSHYAKQFEKFKTQPLSRQESVESIAYSKLKSVFTTIV